ncbi:hypothetical protein [Mycetocola zhujimingii]|uniref:hypothetical protein n=1 Tax=Mycetocola zhujimingii TaxID=2079792 RepID=UPI0013C50A5C|nr:hypothetical protein [Mycetocola zhujimingii]
MSDQFGIPGDETPVSVDDGRRRRRLILWVSVGLAVAVVIALVVFWATRGDAGTGGEASPTPTATATETPTATATPTPSVTPTPTPTPTAEGPDAISLPSECSEVYSPTFFESLNVSGMPLNDETLAGTPPTKSEKAESIRESLPSIDCDWGVASEVGIGSAVNIVDEGQRAGAIEALTADGHTCADWMGGTHCTILWTDDTGEYGPAGESHYFRGNGWVSTHWTQVEIAGYTEDIVATLWG